MLAREPGYEDGLPAREKLIITGLYLSKYDSAGLRRLGFDSFSEAYNVVAYSLNSRPLSIKNYRDEFDPLFPNARRGRHRREIRTYCLDVYRRFHNLDFDSFTALVASFFRASESETSGTKGENQKSVAPTFAQRLITGLAAERYFQSKYASLREFEGLELEDTTSYGCGYDFRLWTPPLTSSFLAVEVKGLKGMSGNISMTPKEYEAADELGGRFFLFVVRNFEKTPDHAMYRNPLRSELSFKKVEQVVVQASWITAI